MPPGSARSGAPLAAPARRCAAALGLLCLVLIGAACGRASSASAPVDNEKAPAAIAPQRLRAAPAVDPVASTTTLPPAAGFVVGRVTAIGDSVMLDYAGALGVDLPGVQIDAAVARQWSTGVQIAEQLRAAGQLGATVVIGLGSNGPVSAANFDAMMAPLAGASRVVFVTVVVDRPWQDEVNSLLKSEAARHANVALADWAALAEHHPGWLYSDGTHLPIDGAGADALAALVTLVVEGD